MIKQDEKLLGQPIFENPEQPVLQNPGVPVPSNEMGNAKPVFSPIQAANAQYVFGTPEERAKSMPQREITPLAKLRSKCITVKFLGCVTKGRVLNNLKK